MLGNVNAELDQLLVLNDKTGSTIDGPTLAAMFEKSDTIALLNQCKVCDSNVLATP